MIYVRNIPDVLSIKLSPDFFAREFRCRCLNCELTIIHPFGLHLLQVLRDRIGERIDFTSAYRCQSHNRVESGKKHSYHIRGMAWDVLLSHEEEKRDKMIKECKLLFPYSYHDDSFVHCDVRGFETRTY